MFLSLSTSLFSARSRSVPMSCLVSPDSGSLFLLNAHWGTFSEDVSARTLSMSLTWRL